MSRSPPEESGDPHVCSGMVAGNPSLVWLSHVQTGVQVPPSCTLSAPNRVVVPLFCSFLLDVRIINSTYLLLGHKHQKHFSTASMQAQPMSNTIYGWPK